MRGVLVAAITTLTVSSFAAAGAVPCAASGALVALTPEERADVQRACLAAQAPGMNIGQAIMSHAEMVPLALDLGVIAEADSEDAALAAAEFECQRRDKQFSAGLANYANEGTVPILSARVACFPALSGNDRRLLVVFGDGLNDVEVVTGGTGGLRRSGKLANKGTSQRGIFLALTPTSGDSLVVQRAKSSGAGSGSSHALARVDRVPIARWYSAPSSEPDICIELDLESDANPETTILALVDGQLVPMAPADVGEHRLEQTEGDRRLRGRAYLPNASGRDLPPADHRITLLRTSSGGSRVLVDRATLREKPVPGGACVRERFDLRPGRTALVHAEVGPSCADVGLDRALFDLRASNFLKDKLQDKFVDVRTLKAGAAGIADVTAIGRSLSSTPPGGARGGLDTEASAGAIFSEFRRQGLAVVVMLDATCRKDPTTGAPIFTIQANAMDLDKAQEGGADDVAGLDLRGSIRGETETAHGEHQLRGAVVAALSRLLHLPYVKLYGLPETRERFEPEGLVTESFDPSFDREAGGNPGGEPWAQEVRAQFASTEELRTTCDVLDDRNRLRGPERGTRERLELVLKPRAKVRFPDRVAHEEVPFLPTHPGRYVVGIFAVSPHGEEVSDFECVHVEPSRRGIWVEAGTSTTNWSLIRNRSVSVQYSQIIAGVPFAELRPALGTTSGGSVVLGYGRTTYQISSPPSWDDLLGSRSDPSVGSAGEFDSAGTLPQRWVRHGVLLGLSGDVTWTPAATFESALSGLPFARRIDFAARGMAFLDLGYIDASGTTSSLQEFRNGRSADDKPFDGSVTIELELTMRMNLGTHTAIRFGDSMTALGVSDALFATHRGDPRFRQISLEGVLTNLVVFGAEYQL